MKQENYSRQMVKMGLHKLETATNSADREDGWHLVSWSGITNTEWFVEAVKVVASEEAYYRPSSKWCKMFDNLCSDEMQERRLYGTKYITVKMNEASELGMRDSDLLLVRRMLSLMK